MIYRIRKIIKPKNNNLIVTVKVIVFNNLIIIDKLEISLLNHPTAANICNSHTRQIYSVSICFLSHPQM